MKNWTFRATEMRILAKIQWFLFFRFGAVLRKKRSSSLTVRIFLVHIRVLVSFCEGIGLLEATVIKKLGLFCLIEIVIWHVAGITVIIRRIT